MSWIAAVLALIALLVAGAALRRARRAAERPPPPPPPPPPPARDEGAEARHAALQEAAAEARAALDALRSRVADLEQEGRETRREADELHRLVETLHEAPPPAPAAPVEPGPRTRIREHLAREGWDDVVLLPEAEEGVWRVEARRGGLVGKGRARVYEDGRVEVTVRGATKAFP